MLRRRQYKSSGGDEYFISIESEDESILFGFVRLRLPVQWIKPSERRQFGVSDDSPFLHDFQLPADGRYGNLAEYEELHATFPELYRAALVREAHVYGAKQKKKDLGAKGFGKGTQLGSADKGETAEKNAVREQQQLTAQSKGYGSKLMEEAERIAKSKGYLRMAVIAGVGTRLYYRLKLGYRSKGTYMVKDFEEVALGTAGKGVVNEHNTKILIAVVLVAIMGLSAIYTTFWFMSTMVISAIAAAYMLLLDYLHFVKIDYSTNVNGELLLLSKVGLLGMNLAVALQLLTAFNPDLFGAAQWAVDTFPDLFSPDPAVLSPATDSLESAGRGLAIGLGLGRTATATIGAEIESQIVGIAHSVGIGSNIDIDGITDSDFGVGIDIHSVGGSGSGSGSGSDFFAASASCKFLWASQLAAYVAAFYVLKMILVKRMVLLVQNPMFGNDSGVRKASGQTVFLLLTMVTAFTACQFLVLNFSDSHCKEDPETGMRICYHSFHESCYWVSVLAIALDTYIYLEFCKRWYAVLLVLMEEMAIMLQWQCAIVVVCMVSCTINMTSHVIIKWNVADEDQGFNAMNGTFCFYVDCCVIATACVLSFMDSLNFVLRWMGVDPVHVHHQIENARHALHIL